MERITLTPDRPLRDDAPDGTRVRSVRVAAPELSLKVALFTEPDGREFSSASVHPDRLAEVGARQLERDGERWALLNIGDSLHVHLSLDQLFALNGKISAACQDIYLAEVGADPDGRS